MLPISTRPQLHLKFLLTLPGLALDLRDVSAIRRLGDGDGVGFLVEGQPLTARRVQGRDYKIIFDWWTQIRFGGLAAIEPDPLPDNILDAVGMFRQLFPYDAEVEVASPLGYTALKWTGGGKYRELCLVNTNASQADQTSDWKVSWGHKERMGALSKESRQLCRELVLRALPELHKVLLG
jgi:hypothetical protein